jgi:hypothetical protein
MEEAAAAAAMVASLPDDVLLEILFRLKDVPAVLFRCATACRRWRRLVAKSSFLRRRWPEPHASSFLSGFFTPKRLAFMDPLPPRPSSRRPGRCSALIDAS